MIGILYGIGVCFISIVFASIAYGNLELPHVIAGLAGIVLVLVAKTFDKKLENNKKYEN